MTTAPNVTHRDWGESATLLVGLILFFTMSHRYTIGGVEMQLILGTTMAVMTALSILTTLGNSKTGTRFVMRCAAVILSVGLIASMANILYLVVYHAKDIEGARLLQTAILIWVSNVIIFSILYHWIGADDFLFPRADDRPTKKLVFLDFLFLGFNTATAFSPTDTAPLTTRARMLMMVESAISLLTIAIAAARAVNILS
jgi:hypothetical protein